MASVNVMQGRELNTSDIEGICGLLQVHPEWNAYHREEVVLT
jgi:hypothetical protein